MLSLTERRMTHKALYRDAYQMLDRWERLQRAEARFRQWLREKRAKDRKAMR